MKTNISIELTDAERLNLGQKYYKKKRMITRADLNVIVKNYISNILEATPPTVEQRLEDPLLKKEWNSLSQLKTYLIKQEQTNIVMFDGFQLVVKDDEGRHYAYTLSCDELHKTKTTEKGIKL